MEHLTEALDRLGVKTCPVCGKTGAKSLCLGCKSVSYCGKACQKVAWPTHKRECRRIKRESEKILDAIAADYAADEAMAADACRPDIPPGAECYICGNDKYWKGDLVRMCACRGPHAGFVHIRCLVANAEVRGEDGDDNAYANALNKCGQCRQKFRGPVAVAVSRAVWLRYAGRAETDLARQSSHYNLGCALLNTSLNSSRGRTDESLAHEETHVAMMERIYGPDHLRTLMALESHALILERIGGEKNMQYALKVFTRIYALRVENMGRDHKDTLEAAGHLFSIQREIGMFASAERLIRETLDATHRVRGPEHYRTLENSYNLIEILAQQGKHDEASATFERVFPVVKRVLGPNHVMTSHMRNFAAKCGYL